MKGTFNRKLVVVVVHQGIPDFEAECAKLIESGYKMHSSEIRLTSSEASYSAVFLLKETETFVNPLFEKWVRKAERRKAAIEMLRRWLYERPVINKQEESSLTLPLLEDIENILMVESSGSAQKFIPRDKWVKGVMKRIEKEVLRSTTNTLPEKEISMPNFKLISRSLPDGVDAYAYKIENLRCLDCNSKLTVIGSETTEYGKKRAFLLKCPNCKKQLRAIQNIYGACEAAVVTQTESESK